MVTGSWRERCHMESSVLRPTYQGCTWELPTTNRGCRPSRECNKPEGDLFNCWGIILYIIIVSIFIIEIVLMKSKMLFLSGECEISGFCIGVQNSLILPYCLFFFFFFFFLTNEFYRTIKKVEYWLFILYLPIPLEHAASSTSFD